MHKSYIHHIWDDFYVRNSAINTFCIEVEYEFSFTDPMVQSPVLEMADSSDDGINQFPIARALSK